VSCAFTVESAVSNLDGVKSAKVEGTGDTTLIYDPEKVSMDNIEKVINDLGYTVKN
jgi:Cu+-exporting ATPase